MSATVDVKLFEDYYKINNIIFNSIFIDLKHEYSIKQYFRNEY